MCRKSTTICRLLSHCGTFCNEFYIMCLAHNNQTRKYSTVGITFQWCSQRGEQWASSFFYTLCAHMTNSAILPFQPKGAKDCWNSEMCKFEIYAAVTIMSHFSIVLWIRNWSTDPISLLTLLLLLLFSTLFLLEQGKKPNATSLQKFKSDRD